MKKGILFVLAAAFLASCQQEEENGVVSSVDRVTITPIITRATEVNFENQDQIGLSITKEDGTEYAKNELMTFNDGAFAGSLKWYPEGADKSSFVAYYPVYRLHLPCMKTRAISTESLTLGRQANPKYFLRLTQSAWSSNTCLPKWSLM